MATEAKRAVTVEIAGAKYRVTSDADPLHLARLAERVDERLASLGAKAKRTASPAQLLAVVALSLAEDLENVEREREQLEERTRDALGQAIAAIDARLAEDLRREQESR